MASLVADYGTSSGSESDSEKTPPQKQKKFDDAYKPGVNLLEVVDDSDNDDKADTSTDEARKSAGNNTKRTPLPNPLAMPSKLPSPALDASNTAETSVFVTSFHRAAEAKSSILEQHVKMTDTDLPAEVGGKKICWNFRKGKCRFGHKCKYSHGHEILGHSGQVKSHGGEEGVGSMPATSHQIPPSQRYNQAYMDTSHGHHQWQQETEGQLPDEDDYLSNAKRKKRVGMSDTLVPPKRAMKEYGRYRQDERPWTLPK